MSCGSRGGERWTCGRSGGGGVAVNLQRVGSIVREIGEPCLSQSPLKVSLAANKMLKPEKWYATFDNDGKISCFHKALKRIVMGGVDPSIRPAVWEFLLGCYAIGSTEDYRQRLRVARRERYENLIKQCQLMHSSIGTGSLAYVVGSKVMDVRASSEDKGIREPCVATRQASADKTNNLDGDCYRNTDTNTSFACCSESSSDLGDLVSVRGSLESAAYDTCLNIDALNGDSEAGESQRVNDSYFDFPPLPVTDLFKKNDEDKGKSDLQNGKISQRKLRFKDEKMHNFEICNNEELIIESSASLSNNALHPGNSQVEMDSADLSHSKNIEKKKEILNRMRISDVPETDFLESTLPEAEAVSKDKVSEWLWTLHRIVVDVVRTDSHLKFYEDTRNLARMSDILAVYAWVDPETGYCQGMSDLLSPFVVLFEDDADAFWCFEMLLRRTRENFQMEGPTGVMKQLQQLWHILELTDREMFAHLSRIGAESLHFAFRMLLVLFRRELPFNEALSMWEMMWAADFNESLINDLVENCLETLVVELHRESEVNVRDETEAKTSSQSSKYENGDCSESYEIRLKPVTPQHFCGLTRNFWSRNDPTQICNSVTSTKKGDDELPVFCVAAILIINRQKIIRETRSIDDMIKRKTMCAHGHQAEKEIFLQDYQEKSSYPKEREIKFMIYRVPNSIGSSQSCNGIEAEVLQPFHGVLLFPLLLSSSNILQVHLSVEVNQKHTTNFFILRSDQESRSFCRSGTYFLL